MFCPYERECEDFVPNSDVCNDINLAQQYCDKYIPTLKEAIDLDTCLELPKRRNYKQGWYELNDSDYLTRNAVMKHFHISRKTFDQIIASTQNGGVNEGKLRTETKTNPHNNRDFTLYKLYCVQKLLKSLQI